MDVVEYEKGRRRMCRTNVLKEGSCKGCGAYNALKGRCDFTVSAYESEDENVIKKNIATVERWIKDNPAKTRQSEFLKMFPDVKVDSGVVVFCPKFLLSEREGEIYCKKHSKCKECRKDYWLAEVTDND